LSDAYPIQNCLKQKNALSPLLLNIATEYAIRKVRGKQVDLKLNGQYNLLDYSHDVNILRGNINSITNTETVTDGGKQVGLEEDAEKTKYIYVIASTPECKAKSDL
jgi:hypothetical protein